MEHAQLAARVADVLLCPADAVAHALHHEPDLDVVRWQGAAAGQRPRLLGRGVGEGVEGLQQCAAAVQFQRRLRTLPGQTQPLPHLQGMEVEVVSLHLGSRL